MPQDQGASGYQVVHLFNLLSSTLSSIEEKRVDTSSVVALLALFNLFSILALVQEEGVADAAVSPDELGLAGTKDLTGILASVLADGGKVGPEMLLGLLQKQGKKLSPQLLTSLLSLISEGKSGEGTEGGGSSKPKPEPPAEKRQGRGLF